MKVVKVEILPARDGEVVTAVVLTQTRKGTTGPWEDGDKHAVKSGTAEASRSVLLEDNERLVIEGRALTQTVVDPVQSSAHEVLLPQEVPPEEERPEPVPEAKPVPEESDTHARAAPRRGR
jgi:hypothetical protein